VGIEKIFLPPVLNTTPWLGEWDNTARRSLKAKAGAEKVEKRSRWSGFLF
jgi:hypothetical protein